MVPLADYAAEDVIAAGSDCSVTVANPMQGIYCAVTRRCSSGTLVNETQRAPLLEAIRAFTLNGAYATFEEDRKGSIEPGKLADLVVLDGSILSAKPEEILSMKPVLTMIDGETVFESKGL